MLARRRDARPRGAGRGPRPRSSCDARSTPGATIIGVNSRNLRTLDGRSSACSIWSCERLPDRGHRRGRERHPNRRGHLARWPPPATTRFSSASVSSPSRIPARRCGELRGRRDGARSRTREGLRHAPRRGCHAGGRARRRRDRLHLLAGQPALHRSVDARSAIAAAIAARLSRVGVFVDQAPEFVTAGRRARRRSMPCSSTATNRADDYASLGAADQGGRRSPTRSTRRRCDAVAGATSTVLLDAHDPVRRGGTGRTIDWSVAAAMARTPPHDSVGRPDTRRTCAEAVAARPPVHG